MLALHERTVGEQPDGASWQDVVAEIVLSCRRRATPADLLELPGAIGVLRGASPVVWVYADEADDAVVDALNTAGAVDEVYVHDTASPLTRRLTEGGWLTDGVATQMARSVVSATGEGTSSVERLRPLVAADMAAVRDALVSWGGCERRVADRAYPDDFFQVAAPVMLFGSVDHGRLVGMIGVRRQARSSMLFGLVVAPDRRGERLAQALVERAVAFAGADGSDFVHAQVNTGGDAVLRSRGFRAVGVWSRLVRAA